MFPVTHEMDDQVKQTIISFRFFFFFIVARNLILNVELNNNTSAHMLIYSIVTCHFIQRLMFQWLIDFDLSPIYSMALE